MAHRRPGGHRGAHASQHTPHQAKPHQVGRVSIAPCAGCPASSRGGRQPVSSQATAIQVRCPCSCAASRPPTDQKKRPAHLPVVQGSKTEAATASASPQSPPATPTTMNPKHTANPLGRDSYTAAAAPSGTPATAAGTGSTGRRVSWKITASWTNSNRSGSPARISVAPRATTRGKPDDGSVIW